VRFAVGVNHTPRWHEFDAGTVRTDLAGIAAAGITDVRFLVPWDGHASILADLETLVGLVADAGLRCLPSLTCSPGIGNIYGGALLEQQVAFAQEAGSRLRAHPAIAAWDIGHAFSTVSPPPGGKVTSGEHASEPAAERTVAGWSKSLAGAFKTSSALPTTVGTTSDDLTHDNNVRLATLCAPLSFASIQGSNVSLSFVRDRLDPEGIPFLVMLTAAFSFKPAFVTGFGNPSYPYYTDEENAAYCTQVLGRLQQDGRLGAYWFNWPGSDSLVAAALGAFAREMRETVKARDMPMISSTYYYRTLPTSMHTLYDAFIGFIEERRRDDGPSTSSR
jgi:hypothetical protein